MKNRSLQFVVFVVASSSLLVACEKGGNRTAPNAVLKAKCERGYDPSVENKSLLQSLSKSQPDNEVAVRTYFTKFESTKENSLFDNEKTQLVSTNSQSEFQDQATSDAILLVEKNCQNLTAKVQFQGQDLGSEFNIKNVKKDSIELESDVMAGPQALNTISVKIEKSARLSAADESLGDDQKKVIKERQIKLGNVITKMTVEVKGTHSQSYVIQQISGDMNTTEEIPGLHESVKIKFDKLIADQKADQAAEINTTQLQKLTVDPSAASKPEAIVWSEEKILTEVLPAYSKEVIDAEPAQSENKESSAAPAAAPAPADQPTVTTVGAPAVPQNSVEKK